MTDIKQQISNSARWTFITELTSKVVTPLANIVLVRILAPEAFGILATILMVISFADILTDAGFQKYIIQKEFNDQEEYNKNFLVAFWTNIFLSFGIWSIIFLFRDSLAYIVGNPSLGYVLAIAGVVIPINAFSSIQLAVMKRDFSFKKIFFLRLISIFVPITVTLPLAILGYEYWSLVIGHIIAQLLLAISVFILSTNKIYFFYNQKILCEMLPFSGWTLIESIAIWLTNWIDIFIVSSFFSAYYLGIYRMSMVSVNSLLGLIVGAVTPVLYSSLSRLQNQNDEFIFMFHFFLKRTALIVIPLGTGIFFYRDLARTILFGENWSEADLMIGLWGFTNCLAIIYCHFCSELYRAKGAPKISLIAQFLHMIFLVPTIYIFSNSFENLVIARNVIRIQFIIVHLGILNYIYKIKPITILNETKNYILASFLMGGFIYYTRILFNSFLYDIFSVLIASVLYFKILSCIKIEKNELDHIIRSKSIYGFK